MPAVRIVASLGADVFFAGEAWTEEDSTEDLSIVDLAHALRICTATAAAARSLRVFVVCL